MNRLNQVRFHRRGRLYPCVSITTNSEALTARTRRNQNVRLGSSRCRMMGARALVHEKKKKEYSLPRLVAYSSIITGSPPGGLGIIRWPDGGVWENLIRWTGHLCRSIPVFVDNDITHRGKVSPSLIFFCLRSASPKSGFHWIV